MQPMISPRNPRARQRTPQARHAQSLQPARNLRSAALVANKSAEATPEADQIPWHRTLASKPAKGAIAMDQKGLVRAVAVRTRLSREELADITPARPEV